MSGLGMRELRCPFTPIRLNKQSYWAPRRFLFLNEARTPSDWNDAQCTKLWLYNLHYFDDLNSDNASERQAQHAVLIDQWIDENPVLKGNGWEPYPLSLRVVNWIKWLLPQGDPTVKQSNSLALQAKILSQSLETHLLGNHLLANAKGMVFVGLYFEGQHAESWLEKGLQILEREIPEQVLADGGHFELTPMYHATITADFLDLLSLFDAFQDDRCSRVEKEIRNRLPGMLSWLSTMSHPDGLVSFFNDSTKEIAPSVAKLMHVAEKLDVLLKIESEQPLIHLAETGYFRFNLTEGVLIGDIGQVGPDYIPGHAHADTLSFELSIFDKRFIVNGGISKYGEDLERHRQRSTQAHSTVEINGENSSEVWGGFRVARRAHPVGLKIDRAACRVDCAHNGYSRLAGKPMHYRTFEGAGCKVVITDRIEGRFEFAVARFHLHPEVAIRRINAGRVRLVTASGSATFDAGVSTVVIESSFYCPEFGKRIPSHSLSIPISSDAIIRTTISWRRSGSA